MRVQSIREEQQAIAHNIPALIKSNIYHMSEVYQRVACQLWHGNNTQKRRTYIWLDS